MSLPSIIRSNPLQQRPMNTSLSGITYSRADQADAAAILDLQKLAYRSEAVLCNDYSIPPLVQTLDELLLEFQSKTVIKATEGNRIIGSVRACTQDGAGYIGKLIVHPDKQGNGIGSRLLKEAEITCGIVEYWELFTGAKSERNLRLYRKHGYKENHRQAISDTLSLVYLRKRNSPPQDSE